MNLNITSYCKINNEACFLDGELFFTHENKEESLTKSVYKKLDIKYPKFYKMDVLSKYGFLATEILLQKNKHFQNYKDDEVALFFANSNSCIQTDLKYQETIQRDKPSPSPSLFVYTLPNIVLGEIAIRNKWFGDNMFFVFPEFNAETILQYINTIFANEMTNACIIGWVNIIEDKNDVFLFSVERNITDDKLSKAKLTENNLKELYQK